jgi:hypothetical protein
MKNFALVAIVAILSIGCGCSMQKTAATPPPAYGAPGQPMNAWEGNTYKALIDTQAGLLKASQQISDGSLPATLKPDLNRAIALQNTAVALLKNYDAKARAGGDLTAAQFELADDMKNLLDLLATLHQPAPATAAAVK